MSAVAIRCDGLSKRYRIGRRERYRTLSGTLTDGLHAPFRRVRDFWIGAEKGSAAEGRTFWALQDVSFEVSRGEVLGIIGRNGAGKSTLLKILARITEPTAGRAEVRGRVASLLEVGTGFHPELTGRENIYLNGAILGMKKAEIDRKFDEIVDFAEVERFIDTPLKHYSSGMYVRLAFAVAAHLEPEILLVDEVLAVGDLNFQKKCLGRMQSAARGGRAVLFVSHNLAAVQSLCRKAALLDGGRLQHAGDVGEVVALYIENVERMSSGASGKFPVRNETYGLGIEGCDVTTAPAGDGVDLEIRIDVHAEREVKNIGVGLSLTSMSGARIAFLGPAITNHVIERFSGPRSCVFTCERIDRYLAGGAYVLDLWLAKPRTEYLVRVENAAVVEIPPKDIYRTGIFFEERYHGPVPLPLDFKVSTC